MREILRTAYKTERYDTKVTFIDMERLEPLTATTASLITISTEVVGSAIDIVAKPIQAYNQPKTVTPNQDQLQQVHQGSAAHARPAALILPDDIQERAQGAASPFKTAVAGSAAGFGGMLKHFTKGMLDAPLAVTEGLRNAPRIYGGKVYQPGRIDDWKSGGLVASKNMVHGIVEGFGGLVASPVRGALAGGPVGLVKGFGVGCLNMGTKVPSGQ